MNLSNNNIKKKKNSFEKKFLDYERFKREIYFYQMMKDRSINIPKIKKIEKNKIIFKIYDFKKIKSQKLFLNQILNFLVKINKVKNYKLYAKEYLKSYNNLRNQVKKRLNKINNSKIDKKYSSKFLAIKKYIKKTLSCNYNNISLLKTKKIISQSDFGIHNSALYKNKIYFYDFEYYGLDHPIKIICDIYYQPEKRINRKLMQNFILNLEKKLDFKLPENFTIFEKLLKVKMMLIILNIFFEDAKYRNKSSYNNDKIKKLKFKRLNKAYNYIKLPFIYN